MTKPASREEEIKDWLRLAGLLAHVIGFALVFLGFFYLLSLIPPWGRPHHSYRLLEARMSAHPADAPYAFTESAKAIFKKAGLRHPGWLFDP